jgi:hypothetical protein
MNTLILSTVENDLHFLWIDWQSSSYDSSFTSAFTHICLRSVISLNKFWSCMSTETDMSATVIETVCIDLLIILKCIICVIQCCTLLSERFIDTFCFVLIKHLFSHSAYSASIVWRSCIVTVLKTISFVTL